MGYTHYADVPMQCFWASYPWSEPFLIFHEVQVNFNRWTGINFAGERLFRGGNVNFLGQFKNYRQFGLGMNREFSGLSVMALRGGPSLCAKGGWNIWGQPRSDTRQELQFNIMGISLIQDFQ